MKKALATLVALMVLPGVALAGVVVEEQKVSDHGVGAPITHNVEVMVQGNKQKSVLDGGKQAMIMNLDDGTQTIIYGERKVYMVMPYPPKGMPMMQGAKNGLNFKKTGESHKVAGYSCDEYLGTGAMGANQITVRGCFSTTAPGSDQFTAFQKTMFDKVKGTPMAMMAAAPPGIPLRIDTSVKVTSMNVPGMTPQQSAQLNQRLANRPPIVTHMTVTKITEQQLADSSFTPPAGFTKQSMPMMGMMGHPMPPHAGGSAVSGGKPAPILPPASPSAEGTKVPE